MRLNNLEIAGFKSFPERAELSFDDGVTAIVGPNGCGKSNVIDAITWVLGEQSARSLRGERMEDIIFSGSDARRPTAAAEVRIQLSQVTAALGQTSKTPLSTLASHIVPSDNGEAADADLVEVVTPSTIVESVTFSDEQILKEFEHDAPQITRDVEVGRRLYRSGESEYLIDGHVCRLRDIQDLLMDSGVGVKAYAVIEQGRIGQILGARPTERRQLLEEAAGVTKYKSRRRSAEIKLEAAQQNLMRVDDIVFEVEKQRAALKRQAAKARRYRRLRDEMRKWEMVSLVRRSSALAAAIDVADERLKKAKVQETTQASSVAELEVVQERLRVELTEADRMATVARDKAHQQEMGLERKQQQIDFDQQRATDLEVSLTGGSDTIKVLEERSSPVQKELLDQQAAHEACRQERDTAAEMMRDAERSFAQAQLAIEGREGDVEAARNELFASANAATALQNVVDNAFAGKTRVSEALSKLEAESSDVQSNVDRVDTECREYAVELSRLESSLVNIRSSREDQSARLADQLAEIERRSEELRICEHDLASVNARVESLEQLTEGRANYEDAARFVLESGDIIPNSGSVVDHLRVDEKYEQAVETCLGDLLQYVVVGSRKDALAGVAFAVDNATGRCGFLIDDCDDEDVIVNPPHESLRSLESVVRVTGEGQSVVRRVLRRRWLATTLEEAEIASKCTGDPIVTLDGIVVRGDEQICGGVKKGASGLLAARREIDSLRARVISERDRANLLARELAKHETELVCIQKALKTLEAEEHDLDKESVGLEMRLGRVQDERVRFIEKQELIGAEARQLGEEQGALEAKETEARESIARLEQEQASADERFMEAQSSLLRARDSIDDLGRGVTEAKAKHAALEERTAALASDVGRLRDQSVDFVQRIETKKRDNKRAASERQNLLATVSKSEVEHGVAVRSFNELRHKIVSLDEEGSRLRERISSNHENIRTARKVHDQTRTDVSQQEVVRATATSDLAHLEQTCGETLQVSLEVAREEVKRLDSSESLEPDWSLVRTSSPSKAQEVETDVSLDDVENEHQYSGKDVECEDSSTWDTDEIVGILRDKIDRLGPVNMMAIDQFDELDDRHEFLTTQRADLLDSIEATGEAIKRIDKTTRERFEAAFDAVNKHFQVTFETLFGGGRAGLVLLDETDPLESGIDVIAQPPGKRLQSIQLLSGGEKALTAMALMFAIFKYRPSPFCLLDEIDAPLDDANIGRFVEMLRGLQTRTQFVLVTHNRKTMEIADRLYGVTMEEPGVSKLISVNMH